ncbi:MULTISPECIES: ABC transporter ATP-binding protein [Dictyoglomus]|uniref:ABC transporter related n=1 Tax=Dictyoglomus turgidum (strain DSM 6724 / Z-1310) TaxID=515635 RepID=B8DZC5_DICTD|nr:MULTISPECIES: ABC transporter ATP-binding protein [Dictyoglomus]ACK41858.1 ABC transporter related [Dictyoglomus turgidum DSM 6724]HBU31287.1 ABC transporter ATP-binding protein [Dictyoglomus sp.]
MKRLKKYIKHNLHFFISAIFCAVFALSLDMFNPKIVEMIIDRVILKNNMDLLPRLLLFMALITFSRVVLGYFKEYFMDLGGSRLAYELRVDLFEHLQKLPFSFFDRINTGELMSRIKEDIDNIWFTFGFGLVFFIEQLFYFLIASVILFSINWRLTLIVLTLVPFIGYIAYKLERENDEIYGEISDQGVRLNTTAQEDIAGIRVVKSFGREKYEIGKFFEENRKIFELNVKQAKIFAKYFPWMDFITNISIALTITLGGLWVIGEKMSIGTLVAYSGYVSMIVWPVRLGGWIVNMLAQCVASLKKIERLFREKPEKEVIKERVEIKEIRGEIIFKNVSFKYKDEYVLKNISFHVKPGETLAIMGLTGSGKTTIVNLIGRFYEPWEGEILIDGVDIRKIDLKTLRENIAYVPQDVFLFSDTVRENIKLGKEVEENVIKKALRDARALQFVKNLPEGLETIVGERGLGLSGGQKQRLTITRALVRALIGSAKILILDDVTSALDMETELYIQKALEKYHLTKIIIAHRVSSVKNADEIILLDNGEVVERGTHEYLLSLKGRYYEIYQEQYGKYVFMEETV